VITIYAAIYFGREKGRNPGRKFGSFNLRSCDGKVKLEAEIFIVFTLCRLEIVKITGYGPAFG